MSRHRWRTVARRRFYALMYHPHHHKWVRSYYLGRNEWAITDLENNLL